MSTKVFVGNLSFSTRENELAEEFEAAGKVVRANIITRGPRSLGYGFVEMADEPAAVNAVKLMDKKVIDGRQINVELAKPRDDAAAAPRPPRAPRTSTGGAPGGAGAEGGERRPRAPRGPRGPRGPRPPREGGSTTTTTTSVGASDGGSPRRPSGRRPRPPAAASAPKAPSTTTLFVANLPFGVTDEGLAEIFQEFKPNLKSAHVVRKINGRSKGFGFVEFDNAEAQNAALKAIDKKSVEGRELSVKIALTEPGGGAGVEGEKAEASA